MTDNTPVSCHYHQRQKCNTTKVEICEADNTYIVILNKRNCNALKTPTPKCLYNNMSPNQENNCWAFDNIRIIVSKRKKTKEKKRKKLKHRTYFITTDEYLKIMAKKCSTPDVHIDKHNERCSNKRQRSDTYLNASTSFRTQCIINAVTLYPKRVPPECLQLLRHPLLQAQLRIYRYHFNEKEETCCCSCNSMSNLIHSLYDCHKEKHFDHFDFFQCGHLQLEERIFGEVHEIPERVVRETKDSIHINTFSADKVSEQRKEVTGLTNLSLLLPDETILKKVYNMTSVQLLKSNAHIENDKCFQQFCELVVTKPRKIRSENLHTSKAARLPFPLLGKSWTERKNIHGVYSLNGLISLGYSNLEPETKIFDVTQKGVDLSEEQIINFENNEIYTKAGNTKVITQVKGTIKPHKEQIPCSFGENGIQPKIEDRKTSEKTTFDKSGKEENFKITTKRVSSEILLRRRNASFMIPFDKNIPEQKENMHRCHTKHSISLQDVKTTSEKKILKRVRKDFILFKEKTNTVEIKRHNKSSVLDETIRSNKVLLNKDNDETSPEVYLDAPLVKRKKIVKQIEQTATMENKWQTEKPSKNTSASSIIPSEENIKLNITPKSKGHRPRGIPVLVDRIASKKKPVDTERKSGSLLPPSQTTQVKTTFVKNITLSTPLYEKSTPGKENKLRSLAGKDKQSSETRDRSEKVDKGEPVNTILVREIGNEHLDEVVTQFDNARDSSFCSIFMSQVKQIERTKSKSLIEKKILDKAQGTHTLFEQATSDTLKDGNHMYTPQPEGKTCWDKVLIKKIKDELAVLKHPDEKLRKVRVTGLNKHALNEKNTTLKEKMQDGVPYHGISLLDYKAASKVRKDIDLPSTAILLSEKERYAKAQYLKQFTPLEGKTDIQKEKILRALVGKGKPLPEGRTKAEKALIDKVRAESALVGHSCFTKYPLKEKRK